MPESTRKRFLTDDVIFNLAPAVKRRYAVYDSEQNHLCLRINPLGGRTWHFCSWRNTSLKIGSWPEIKPDQARDIVARILMAAKMGETPQRFLAKRVWATATFRKIFEQYLEEHLKQHAAPRTARAAETGFEKYFSSLLDLPVQQITNLDVQRWMNQLAKTSGEATANKQFVLLKAALRWADVHGLVEIRRSPTIGVKTFPDVQREQYLKPEQYEQFYDAVDALHNQDHADIIRILLLTGVRKSNAFAMAWEQIDWDARTWNVPISTTNKRTPLVALTDEAIDILNRRRNLKGNSKWVFPAESKSGHVEDIRKAWNTVRKAAELGEGFVLHSLRHTVGTMMGQTNASAFAIQGALGHTNSRTSQRYTKHAVEPQREARERAWAYLTKYRPTRSPIQTSGSVPALQLVVPRRVKPAIQDICHNKQNHSHAAFKNANIQISGPDQVIVEAKILTTLRMSASSALLGGNSRKHFYRKIGPQFRINSSEMDRILKAMIDRGLIVEYRLPSDWHTARYKIRENSLIASN